MDDLEAQDVAVERHRRVHVEYLQERDAASELEWHLELSGSCIKAQGILPP